MATPAVARQCPHAVSFAFRAPTQQTKVYREECTQCFHSQDMDAGVFVCLQCFNAGCDRHAPLHCDRSRHALVMRVCRVPKPATLDDTEKDASPPRKITKLVVQDSVESDHFDFQTSLHCLQCAKEQRKPLLSMVIQHANLDETKIRQAILFATSAQQKSDIQAWQKEEAQPCEHTLLLEPLPKPDGHSLAHCHQCEQKENLWLCMTCGNLGCGRRQYDGSGGNNHGVEHYESTQHPLACKLGTITAEGTADIYCYACDDMKLDPALGEHLAHFGINISSLQKTVKSMAELELEQNLKFDFSMVTEDGKSLEPIFGPALTGIKNIGNSCYLASTVQAFVGLPAFQRYNNPDHALECTSANPAACFQCQMNKMVHGLLSGAFSKPAPPRLGQTEASGFQAGVPPTMFKAIVGGSHPEFSSMRQQDVYEFFQHFLKTVEEKGRVTGVRGEATDAFRFLITQRLQCTQCERVRYSDVQYDSLGVPVRAHVLRKNEEDGSVEYVPQSFQDCLKLVFEEELVEDFACPQCKERVVAKKEFRFKTFPSVLVCQLQRFVLENWVPKKLNVPVVMQEGALDLSQWKSSWPFPGEQLFPDKDEGDGNDGAGAGDAFVDQIALEHLQSMGFSKNRCVRALLETQGGAEVAMEWLFTKMDDPTLDDPLPPPTSNKRSAAGGMGEPSPEQISGLQDMGFTAQQARKALRETKMDMERAVEWLFAHPEDTGETVEQPPQVQEENVGIRLVGNEHSRFLTHAVISHKGTSVHHGHYVVYVRNHQQWVLFNDEKVVVQPDGLASEGMQQGYVVVLKQT